MTLIPIGNRVVVQLKEKETATASGIIISANPGEKEQQYGLIVSVGTGKSSEGETPSELGLNVGDVILFSKYGGEEVKDDSTGNIFKVLKTGDIVAIVID